MENWSLIGDIGGTNARFAAVNKSKIIKQATFSTNDDKSLLEISNVFINEFTFRPKNILLAIAGPVNNGKVELTNANQHLDETDLAEITKDKQAKIINDFEAAAWALATVKETDCRNIIENNVNENGHRIILGVGTGLGVGSLVWTGKNYIAVPGEGGHRSIAPSNEFELEVFKAYRYFWPEVFFDKEKLLIEAEGFLSGTGLPKLYQAISKVYGNSIDSLTTQALFSLDRKKDNSLNQTLSLFSFSLGSLAGDLAVTLNATGGVYFTGGVLHKNPELLDKDFIRGFTSGGREIYTKLRQSYPVKKFTHNDFGLIGAANALKYYFK